jgi:hypothetical protein
MKTTIYLILATVLLFSCSKNKDENDPDAVPPKEFEDKIELNNPIPEGENLKLSWSKLNDSSFMYYTVMRRGAVDEAYQHFQMINDRTASNLIDTEVPYSPEVSYQIIAHLRNGTSVASNAVSYKRPDINLLNINPFDVIYQEADQLLYFFEKTGRISIYDLKTNKITKQISTQSTIGYSDMETFQGKKELYVPRNDGWIFVYDAYTLEKITQITVGLESTCVVSNQNILYVSTSAWTNRPLKVYQRADRRLIAETGNHDRTRFRKVPGTSTALLEITLNVGPTDQRFYEFNAQGAHQRNFSDQYHGDYPLDANIFAFFPNGTKYITSGSGAIYNINLTFDKSLPRGNLHFTSFAFDNSGSQIYAATSGKSIEVYSTSDYNHLKSIKTKAYPYRIFNTSKGILVISTYVVNMNNGYSNPSVGNIIIENLSK